MNNQVPESKESSSGSGFWRKRKFAVLNAIAWIVMIAVAVFFFLKMQGDREEKERIRSNPSIQGCMDRMTRIGAAIRQYAGKHGGAYPESLTVLVSEKYLPDADSLKCPESGSEYLYLYDKEVALPCSDSMPLVIEKLESHSGKVNILYADNQVRNEPIVKKRYSRIALRKSSCTKKEQRYLKKRLRELDRAFSTRSRRK